MSSGYSCVILGGGISGLSLAHFLRKKHGDLLNLTIIEESHRVGGWIRTTLSPNNKGVFEHGPQSIRSSVSSLAAMELVLDLNLQDRLLFGSESSRKRFLYLDGRLQQLPSSPWNLLSSPLAVPLVGGIIRDIFAPSRRFGLHNGNDESISSFFTRRFGSRVMSSFVEPMVTGIFAGNPKKLSVRSCFPSVYEAERKKGSVFRGLAFSSSPKHLIASPQVLELLKVAKKRGGMFSFEGGLQVLPDAIASSLPTNCIRLNACAKSIQFEKDHVLLALGNGDTMKCGTVFSALPSHSLAKLIKHPLSGLLDKIPFVSVAVVNVEYSSPEVANKLPRGFGYLIPPKEHQSILGVMFASLALQQPTRGENDTILTVMIGGDPSINNPNSVVIDELGEDDLSTIALEHLHRHLNISDPPTRVIVTKCRNAIPQYHLGHHEVVKKLQEITANDDNIGGRLALLGNSFHGVGLSDSVS